MAAFIFQEDDIFKPLLEHQEKQIQIEDIDYIVVTFSKNNPIAQRLDLVQESIWIAAKNCNCWSYRLDPQMPNIKQQRHVHITKTKWINSKTNHFSWNQDGTRHDKKTFCKSEKGIGIAKQIASEVLEVPIAVFECASPSSYLLSLSESAALKNYGFPEHTIYLTLEQE